MRSSSKNIVSTRPSKTRLHASRRAAFMSFGLDFLVIGASAGLLGQFAFCAPAGGGFGDLGTTTGGPQDIGQARAVILDGGIPDPGMVTVEGFIAEHEIPLSAPDDAGEFFAYSTLAWRQPYGTTTGAAMADLITSIGTTIDVSTFEREPQNLTVVIDRSGSMDHFASATDNRTKMEAVKDAMEDLLNQLTPADDLSIITFNNKAKVQKLPTSVVDDDEFLDAIHNIEPSGDTDIAAGLQLGYETNVDNASTLRANRLILFTDALPNDGNIEDEDFIELIEAYADLGVGFTLMAVGIDYGYDLGNRISRVRNANAYYLENDDRIAAIFYEEFAYLVTPAAYDLVLDVTVPEGIGVAEVYGVDDYVPGTDGARIEVPTLFFSGREGGAPIIVRLTFSEAPDTSIDNTLANVSLSYTLTDGTELSDAFDFVLPAGTDSTGDPAYFTDDSARRAALLLDTALVIQEALEDAWNGSGVSAADDLEAFLTHFDVMSLGLADRTDPTSRGLSDERDLIEALIGNLRASRYYFYHYNDNGGYYF